MKSQKRNRKLSQRLPPTVNKKAKIPEKIKWQWAAEWQKKPRCCGASILVIGQSVIMSQSSYRHKIEVNSTASSVSGLTWGSFSTLSLIWIDMLPKRYLYFSDKQLAIANTGILTEISKEFIIRHPQYHCQRNDTF